MTLKLRLVLDRARLDAIMDQRGIENYDHLSELTKQTDQYVSRRTIYDMLDSDRWSTKNVHAIADALGCGVTEIVFPKWMDESGKAVAPAGTMQVADVELA